MLPAVMGGSISQVEQGATSDLEDDAPQMHQNSSD